MHSIAMSVESMSSARSAKSDSVRPAATNPHNSRAMKGEERNAPRIMITFRSTVKESATPR